MSNYIKSISNPNLKLEFLSPEEIDRIHLTTLEIVGKVGVRFPSQNTLEIWESNGAQVDWSQSVVKIPSNLLGEALKLAPPDYTLAARQIEQDLPLDGNHVYLGTDGCGVEVTNYERYTSELYDNIAESYEVESFDLCKKCMKKLKKYIKELGVA